VEENTGSKSLVDIARLVNGTIVGKNTNFQVTGLAALDRAGPGDISFLTNLKYKSLLDDTKAGAVLISGELPDTESEIIFIVVKDAYLALARLLSMFHPPVLPEDGFRETAIIHPEASIGKNVKIAPGSVTSAGASIGDNTAIFPGVYIGKNVSIGADCIIYPNVSIYHEVSIGCRVIIHAGAVIGSDGFGFARERASYVKISQIGSVIIQDDVEIGANCTVDRGSMGMTVIERGVKLDNLCHLAHNVTVGCDTVFAAQTGISGSTSIGKRNIFGGQVGLAGHIKTGDDVVCTAKSGVTKSVPEGKMMSGFPHLAHGDWRKQQISIRRLPKMMSDLKAMNAELSALKMEIESLYSSVKGEYRDSKDSSNSSEC